LCWDCALGFESATQHRRRSVSSIRAKSLVGHGH
jgi:hypothetical protein